MAAEAASSGPRYAPEDPTLPQPWKGLIDGSTGLMYYWNPETNVTQYEKPAELPPPLPPGMPALASHPTMAPIPAARTAQNNDVQSHQAMQAQQQQPQVNSGSQQQMQGMLQGAQPNSLQVGPNGPQHGSLTGTSVQQPGHPMPQQLRPQMQYPGQQMPLQHESQIPQQAMQPMQPMAHHFGQQNQMYQFGPPVGNPQGYQFPPQQAQYMPLQPSMPPQGQQNSQQQSHQIFQGQQYPHPQEQKVGFNQRDDADPQWGKQVGFSPTQNKQSGSSSVQNPSPAGTNHVQISSIQPSQGTHFGGPSVAMQQPTSLPPVQQSGGELAHQQHGPRFQSQVGPGSILDQQQKVPAFKPNMGYEGSPLGRASNDYYHKSTQDGNTMVPQQPKLAAIPMGRNVQEMRRGDLPPKNMMPSHPGGHTTSSVPPIHDMYGHPTGGPQFANNASARPPPAIMGSLGTNSMHGSDAEIYCQTHEVTASGENVPPPFMTFEATGFPPEILREIFSAGFTTPTPIQAQTWPIALQNRDIVAIAKTGSGKTLGYIMPAFMHLRRLRNNPQLGPTVLVLAPTRELATQIQDEAIKFGQSSRITCTCLYGGAPKGPQLKEIERGADIIVATPGRLNDILDMKRIDFRQVSLLVLDEADRMLDMGFEPQLRKIVNEIPPRRQTLMYTATWPKEVMKIANDLLVNPVQVTIGRVDELAANKSITQYVEVVPQIEKQKRLEQIIRSQEHGSKVIIFCSTKRLCDQLTRNLSRNFGAAAIHGDKNQGERDWVLNQFRSGKTPILVATDVAARGLDIRDIRVVINYDFPTGIEDYVHRIGRTGRAGATGIAYTFFSEQDWKYAADLVKVLEGANQQVPPEVRDIALRGAPSYNKDRGGGGMGRFDYAGGGGDVGGGRWDSGGRGGMRDGGFGGRGGMREGGFGDRGGMRGGSSFGGRGMRDGGFPGRGGMRDGGFGGRGGSFGGRGGMRDGNFGGRSMGDFGGPRDGYDRNDRGGFQDRYNTDMRGRGSGGAGAGIRGSGSRGRGRFDNRRDSGDRGRGRNYSSSPERARTRGRSRSRSRSYSRSRSRSWSRSYSPRRSRSRTLSRSRSVSPERVERRPRRASLFDQVATPAPNAAGIPLDAAVHPVLPDTGSNGVSGNEQVVNAGGFQDAGSIIPGNLAPES